LQRAERFVGTQSTNKSALFIKHLTEWLHP
jgi:hypothetical protein